MLFSVRKLDKHRLSIGRLFELRAHVVEGGLLQWRGSGITKSKDQITRSSKNSFPSKLNGSYFAFEMRLSQFFFSTQS